MINNKAMKQKAGGPYELHRDEVATANLFMLQRISAGAFANMTVLAVISPFLGGFFGAEWLYISSAAFTAVLSVFSFTALCRHRAAILPLFYVLLGGFCCYAVILSSFIYPEIHGVTIIGIFVLVPILILDKTWRVNLFFTLIYVASCVLAFMNKPSLLAVDDCTTCGAFLVFGILIGIYMRKTRINAIIQQYQTEKQRDYDALTGLPNRRFLFEILGDIDNEKTDRKIDGLFMLDIDNFKKYNDVNGHQAGDECLQRIGRILLNFSAENNCTTFRYGGEEFLVLLSGIGCEKIKALAEELVHEVQLCGDFKQQVTISLGYVINGSKTNSNKLIRMADKALYKAKSSGKCRAVCYCETDGLDFI